MNNVVGQSIPYLNAGLQGMDKLRRGLFTGEEASNINQSINYVYYS